MAPYRPVIRHVALLATLSCLLAPAAVVGQAPRRFLPARSLMPDLHAGPRDPVTKGELLAVPHDPDSYGDGVEAEVALGTSLPILRLAGTNPDDAVVVGVEAAAFARFALQILERELVATDWVFAVPVVWHANGAWVRLRYFHTSSHMGDEYARRFDEPGVNFSRDAVDALGYTQVAAGLGIYGGMRWAYNVHPEDSGRWAARLGLQAGNLRAKSDLRPFGSFDLEMDQDVHWRPRAYAQIGVWLPEVGGRRALRLNLSFLTGPSPLGQFQGLTTTQIGIGVSGNL